MVHGHFRPENQVTRRHRKIARDFRCGVYVPCNSFTLRIFWKQPQFQHTVYGLLLEASEWLPARTDGPWEHKNICPQLTDWLFDWLVG